MMNFHARTTELPDKNPLHASALGHKDMKRGRQVVLYSVHRGILVAGTIISLPISRITLMSDKSDGQMIRLKHHADGQIGLYDLAALGVVPYPIIGWSTVNFLIDLNKSYLLNRFNPLLAAPDNAEHPHA